MVKRIAPPLAVSEGPGIGPARTFGGPWIGDSPPWMLFVGLGLVMVGSGLNSSVLGVRAEAEGFGLGVTGVVMAAYFAGFLAGTRFAETALGKVGHIRVFAGLASLASSVVLLQGLWVEPFTWAATRFVFGACMAGLFVVVESWLNEMASNTTRGRVLSVYMIVSTGSVGFGQLLLNVDDESGFTLFILVSVLVSLSLVPVTLSASSAPALAFPEPVGVAVLVRQVPTGVLSSLLSGAAAGVLLGIAPVFGSAVGMPTSRLSVFLVVPMLGGLVFQWPVGWLSDRFPRRGVMFVVALIGALAPLAALLVSSASSVTIVAMFVLGGAMFPFYSLTVAYTNDWIQPWQRVGASATLVRVNGTGAIIGPLLAAALMAAGGPRMFFWLLAALFGLAAAHLLYRILSRPPLPLELQTPQVAFPVRATAMAASLLPRRVREEKSQPTDRPSRRRP